MADMSTIGRPGAGAPRLRVGNDLCRVADVSDSIDAFGQRYLDRVYTQAELAACSTPDGPSPERLAARFAAKESVVKVLRPAGGVHFHDIEILVGAEGAPMVHLHRGMERRAVELGVVDASLSLSHDHDLAAAVVVAVMATADSSRTRDGRQFRDGRSICDEHFPY